MMIIQALIGVLTLIIVLALSFAFLPLLGAGLASLGSLGASAATRIWERASRPRTSRKPKTPAIGTPFSSGK